MPEPLRIADADRGDSRMVEEMAALLVEGFREHWPRAWPDLESVLFGKPDILMARRLRKGDG